MKETYGEMGYPMTYRRILHRNALCGDYEVLKDRYGLRSYKAFNPHSFMLLLRTISGDLRRLERDQRDDEHLRDYAARAGVTTEQAKRILDAFFDGEF